MPFNLNKTMLAGHLVKNPQTKDLGGKTVTHFSLAVNKRYKTKEGEFKDKVLFIDCEAWNRTGELIVQYLHKGSACYIEGELVMDTWDDKASGQKKSKIKVVADQVQFIPNANKANEGEPAASPATPTDDQPPF